MSMLDNTTYNFSVLLVEDEKIVQITVQRWLERLGCRVDLAENGKEAIEKSANNYDLILMDIGLPDMSGIEAAIKIKQDALSKHIPIVAVTAYQKNEMLEECQLAGIKAVYNKPLIGEDLAGVLLRHAKKA